MDDTYLTISRTSEGIYKEKMSKFLAFAIPVSSVEDVKKQLEKYQKEYYDARHVCWAYMLGPQRTDFRSNDNGEPSGTAGKPILGQINSAGLTDILIVVVRYFGGIKLGTSGLIVAYREAASEAIAANEIIERQVEDEVHFGFEYPLMNEVMRIVKEEGPTIVSQIFDMDCEMTLRIRRSLMDNLKKRLSKVDGVHFINEEETNMTEKEKMEKGELYDAAIPELIEQLLSTRDKIFELNHLRPSQLEEREKLIREIIGTTPEKFIIISPFFCDYGHNIHLGKNFFANYNCVMLDEAPITIGDNVFIAPNVSFYTAGHPSDVERRNEWLEYAWPITVGNNVWICGGVTITPGVTIGDNSIIAAGSVVTNDIPSNVIAGGNPCRVIRTITEKDKLRSFSWEEKKAKKQVKPA